MSLAPALLAPYYLLSPVNVWRAILFDITRYLNIKMSKKPVLSENRKITFYALMSQESHKEQPDKRHYWDHVADGIFLGKAPEKGVSGEGDDVKIIDESDDILAFVNKLSPERPLGQVITVLDYFELANIGVGNLVSPADWERKVRGISHDHIIISDFDGKVSPQLVLRALYRMKGIIDSGYSVYIHCKAGAGRSALMVLLYLFLFGDGKELLPGNLMRAYNYLKYKRKININKNQFERVQEVVDFYRNMNPASILTDDPPIRGRSLEDLHSFLKSFTALDAIRHLTSFKELALYAIKHLSFGLFSCKRSEHIRNLFAAIYHGQTDWLKDIVCNRGPLQELIDVDPLSEPEDKKIRQALAAKFKEDVLQLSAYYLSWEKTHIVSLYHAHDAYRPSMVAH